MDAIQPSEKDLMGTVKFFDEKRGWGFIKAEGIDQDIFVHYKHILVEGYRSLVKNELVLFEPTQTARGIMAAKVRKLS